MITIKKAIKSLNPELEFVVYNNSYDEIVWYHEPESVPTRSEVEAEIERLIAEQPAKEARGERDRLLTESDWVTIRATDTGDPAPADWQEYRQALRDITEQTGFPENIEWPQEPEA